MYLQNRYLWEYCRCDVYLLNASLKVVTKLFNDYVRGLICTCEIHLLSRVMLLLLGITWVNIQVDGNVYFFLWLKHILQRILFRKNYSIFSPYLYGLGRTWLNVNPSRWFSNQPVHKGCLWFTLRRDKQEIYLYNIQKQQGNEEENIN